MVREFKLPDVGEGVAEGELVSWLVEASDAVSEDQPVAEVETDKALVEVPSPVNGTVRELRAEEGDVVPVGDVLITFDVEGESPADPESASSDESCERDPADGETGETPSIGSDSTGESTGGHVFAPPRVRRLAREEGVDLSTIRGSGPGGRVTEADVQAVVDGEVADESGSESAGVSGETSPGESGDSTGTDPAETTTPVDSSGSAEPSAAKSSAAESSAPGSSEPDSTVAGSVSSSSDAGSVESADRDRTLAAPATRRLAEEEGVDLDAVPATEERDGEAFVTPEAVREYAQAQQEAQAADAEALAVQEEPAERERREPFTGVRKTIASAMVESKFTAPHVTHHDEVDVTKLVEIRDRLKPRAEEQGIRLTYMPFIMKAVVAALEEFPEMNAVIDDDNDEVVYRNYYNIGVATATDVGLMVPVVEDADRKGLLQLSSEMNELVTKARERSISPDELRGSTFTITNVGGIGGEYATPILNYPESGILAVGEIKRKPRVIEDPETGAESIEPRSVMTLSLSFDHRLIDGAIGARFTNEVMQYLEDPELLLLE